MRALIVDDSRFVRGYVRSLLEEKGIDCEEAGDGQAALDLVLGGEPFDVALVDWVPTDSSALVLSARKVAPCWRKTRQPA